MTETPGSTKPPRTGTVNYDLGANMFFIEKILI